MVIPSHNYQMTRATFAKVLGVSETTIIKWEKKGLAPEKVQVNNSSRYRFNINHILQARKQFRPLEKKPCQVLIFWLLKGGVGKTTISFNLAGVLSRMGYKVLAVDLDGQSHLTACTGVTPSNEEYIKTLFNLLYAEDESTSPANFEDVIIRLSPTLDLIPASLDTAAIDLFLLKERPPEQLNKLRTLFDRVRPNYDFIILDAAPNINLLNINALFASDLIISPFLTDYLSHHSLALLYDTIEIMTQSLKGFPYKVPEFRLLANRFDIRSNLCQESLAALKTGAYQEFVLNTVIMLSSAFGESTKRQKPVFAFSPTSTAAQDIETLATELLNLNIQSVPKPPEPVTPTESQPNVEVTTVDLSGQTIIT